ncbi:hypothetical protein AOA80_00995 [Methanomassiliicoccales archaeon RumEn M1]|nr:hypothetical protein AOA80_00995 [Methanomassiliicoccales archaeon RumEn M1]
MLEHIIEQCLPTIISACELMGISWWPSPRSMPSGCTAWDGQPAPQKYQFQLAEGLATSLEFKMAAEILKTVLVRDLNELMVLGAVILLRALLSLLIHFEMKKD